MLNLLYALFVIILSFFYTLLYLRTRKASTELFSMRTIIILFICFVWNSFLLYLRHSILQYPGLLLWLCLILIADIDALIGKIPSELILLAALGCGASVRISAALLPVVITVFLLLLIGFSLHKKAGIARYDLIYFGILAILCPDVAAILKYLSLFLILWGITGICIKKTDKSGRIRSIPLTPFILTAYSVMTMNHLL